MKKKSLSLFLTLALILAFTVASYANAGEHEYFNLDPGESESVIVSDNELEANDDDMFIGIVLNTSRTVDYTITLFDITEGRDRLWSRHFDETDYYNLENYINPSHDYEVEIYNSGSEDVSGNMYVVVE
ncbi:hypothetical protein [Wukongibacter sp. M2B1]|uniref:hypothetical protein n=1 Tax=Wukongibacter sp. M2B1 TaxID=3088895 RepID=UPI003D798693